MILFLDPSLLSFKRRFWLAALSLCFCSSMYNFKLCWSTYLSNLSILLTITPWSIAAVFGNLCFERLIIGFKFIMDFLVPLICFLRYLCISKKWGVGPSTNGYIWVRSSGVGKIGPQILLSHVLDIRGLCLLRRSINAIWGFLELLSCWRYYCLRHSLLLIVELLFVTLVTPVCIPCWCGCCMKREISFLDLLAILLLAWSEEGLPNLEFTCS